jgi:hypothetical protein
MASEICLLIILYLKLGYCTRRLFLNLCLQGMKLLKNINNFNSSITIGIKNRPTGHLQIGVLF